MSDDITIEKVQALITRGPYHQWLGLTVIALGDASIELKATWREEWVVNPERRYTHGGVLAALVDLAVAKLGPIGAEVKRLVADQAHIDAVLADGAARAQALAAETMKSVKDIVGFIRR